ncbi:MAG: aminotransferase class III-fold pyridoxal phosphate-dependent enzyme, partial [Desulfobacterales bacterium]
MNPTVSNQTLADTRANTISAGVSSINPNYVASAQGALITDVEGNQFIDFAGGIAVMNIGHSHPKVVAAIKAQAEKFVHTCFMVNPYESAVRLAQKLAALTPGDFPKRCALVNSGAEAVENAVKIARYYTQRPAVIVFDNAYHGRTLLTMTMTSKVKPYKFGFGPFAPEVYRMPFGDTAGPETLKEFFVKQVNPEAVACVVAEPVQGEGGFICPPEGYFQKIAQICKDNGILFVADEIQSGMGRTGKMFAIEHWGVEPDLITVAKSLAAGMPLAAVVGRAEVMDAVHPSGLGGTYGGNPVACEAALAVLEVFEQEGMLEKSQALGAKLKARFEQWRTRFAAVGEIRGLGAMLGLT